MISRRRNEHLGNLALMPYLLSKGIQHVLLPLSIIQEVVSVKFCPYYILDTVSHSTYDTS